MRTLNIGSHRFTNVVCLDEPSLQSNACHKYEVHRAQPVDDSGVIESFVKVSFQNGLVKEVGINGCHNEDLITIVIDRLQSFQSGKFECRENALAITKLEEAMHWLNHRTSDRQNRGVEGKNVQ